MATKSSSNAVITKPTFDFLRDLVQNNNREWFQTNRARYDAAKNELCGVVQQVLTDIKLV